jgi:hypothetical protein
MEIIPQLINRYSVVLYAVCAIACAYFLFTGLASLRELRRAVFRLERNAVVTRAVSSLLKAVMCLAIGAAIFGVTAFAPAPSPGSLLGAATGTPVALALPTSMPTADISTTQTLASASFTPTIVFVGTATVNAATAANPAVQQAAQSATVLTGTQAAAAAQAAQPTLAPELIPDCTSAKAQITSPEPGERVVGAYTVRGTAQLEAGGWYKLEILTPGAVQWAFVGRGDASVNGGVLFNNFPAGNLPPGTYPLRLVLVGADGGIRAICRVPIIIGS